MVDGLGWWRIYPLEWRHNERDSVSDRQPHKCLFNRLFKRRSKKTSKLRVTGLCAGNSPGTGEFPAQKATNAENVSIWWRHHALDLNELTVRPFGNNVTNTKIIIFDKFQHFPLKTCLHIDTLVQERRKSIANALGLHLPCTNLSIHVYDLWHTCYHFLCMGECTVRNSIIFAPKNLYWQKRNSPDSKVHGVNMGPIWGRQDPGGAHVGLMNLAICRLKW